MKYCFLTLILSLGQAAFAQYDGDSFKSAKEKGTATIYFVYSNAPGFVTKEDGTYSGVCVDLMAEFERYVKDKYAIDLHVQDVTKDYDNFPAFLKDIKNSQGGVFGLNTTTITEERKKVYEISPAFITNVSMLVSNAAAPSLNSLEEMSAKFSKMTAVTVRNSSNEKTLVEWKTKYFPNMPIEYVNTNAEVMKVIASEANKFTDVDFIYYFEALRDKQPVKRHAVGDDANEKFGIIMPKGSDWAPVLAEFMNSGFLGSPAYKKILSDNLGQSAMKFFESLK